MWTLLERFKGFCGQASLSWNERLRSGRLCKGGHLHGFSMAQWGYSKNTATQENEVSLQGERKETFQGLKLGSLDRLSSSFYFLEGIIQEQHVYLFF